MENKLLITGLGVGQAFDVCQVCNMNYSWLVKNPSSLIWADKICIPENSLKSQLSCKEDKQDIALRVIIEKLSDSNVIEPIDIKSMYQPLVGNNLYKEMKKDITKMQKVYPSTIKKGNAGVPDSILIDNNEYCGPYLASIYASLKLANDIGAHCMFGDRDYAYLKYKLGIDFGEKAKKAAIAAYNEIFTFLLPNDPIFPEYFFTSDERCNTCGNKSKCSTEYVGQVEYALNRILRWRDYDEIYMVKEEISKILLKQDSIDDEMVVKEIKSELQRRQKKINAMINKRFPQIKRFTNLVTVLAVPVSAYSIFTANPVATAISSLILALSRGADGVMDYYKNKNKWVGFINKQ